MRSRKTSPRNVSQLVALSQLAPHQGWIYVPKHTSLTSQGWRPRWVQLRAGWVSYAYGEGNFVSLGREPDWEERT